MAWHDKVLDEEKEESTKDRRLVSVSINKRDEDWLELATELFNTEAESEALRKAAKIGVKVIHEQLKDPITGEFGEFFIGSFKKRHRKSKYDNHKVVPKTRKNSD